MENKSKSMFKVTLKGAHEIDGKTEMVNKDFEGQLAVVITLKETEEGVASAACITGGVHADVPVMLLKTIRGMIGKKDFYTACALVILERAVKDLEAEVEAAEAEKAAEEILNGVADDDVGQTPYGEGGEDE